MFSNDGVKVQEFIYDFDKDGGAQGAINLSQKAREAGLPAGALVLWSSLKKLSDLSSAGAATVALGNGDAADAYVAATGYATVNSDGHKKYDQADGYDVDAANKEDVLMTIAGADLDGGKLRVHMAYVLGGKTE